MTTENNQLQLHYQDVEMSAAKHSGSLVVSPTQESYIFLVFNNVVLGALVTLFGTSTNVINMIVFRRQGFATTANISFFSLALSDFLCILTYEGFNLCVNPLVERSSVPFISTEFQHLISGWFHVCFGRITSWITVYITAERCLGVALPLKVKQLVSPRKTTVCMFIIFAIHLILLSPEYCIRYLDWKFVPERNKTLIGLVYRNFGSEAIGVVYALTSISGMLSFVVVIMLTTFLTIKLTQTSNWHSKVSTNDVQSEARSLRDKKTIKLVVMIATILIICYTPGAIISLGSVFEPEFAPSMKHNSIYFNVWSFGFLCNSINSSVNMFLYYNMSTKYRETFNQLFVNCMKTREKNKTTVQNSILKQ